MFRQRRHRSVRKTVFGCGRAAVGLSAAAVGQAWSPVPPEHGVRFLRNRFPVAERPDIRLPAAVRRRVQTRLSAAAPQKSATRPFLLADRWPTRGGRTKHGDEALSSRNNLDNNSAVASTAVAPTTGLDFRPHHGRKALAILAFTVQILIRSRPLASTAACRPGTPGSGGLSCRPTCCPPGRRRRRLPTAGSPRGRQSCPPWRFCRRRCRMFPRSPSSGVC
jgi:hypothetical protein